MRNDTRELFDAFTSRIAELNGVSDAMKMFTVDPTVQQTLENRIQESSEFLGRVNVIGVPELKGALLGLGINSTVAGRTDTSGAGRRTPRSPTGMDGREFELKQTDFDTFVTYGQLDLWAKFPDFQTRITNMVTARCALDRIMIGFNGTSAAATTDRAANPLLQDVNIGWLQQQRVQNPTRVFDEGAKVAGKILVGPGGDYKTLDALVYDSIHSFLPTWTRGRTDLVAICGDGLLHDKYMPLIADDKDPTEQLARDVIMSTKRLGGKQAAEVPFVPEDAIFVTTFDNLSIYFQDGKRRRHIREEPDANRIADYQSSNEGYVIEDLESALLIEKIEIITADD